MKHGEKDTEPEAAGNLIGGPDRHMRVQWTTLQGERKCRGKTNPVSHKGNLDPLRLHAECGEKYTKNL